MGCVTEGMVQFARNMVKHALSEQYMDAAMLSKYQLSNGLVACREAIRIARLEEAAPELLDALHHLHVWLVDEGYDAELPEGMNDRINALFEKIAKGRGAD